VRFRRSMALRPVNRIKHVVDASATLASGNQIPQPIIIASDTPALADVANVFTGAKVYGVYLKVVVASNEAMVNQAIPHVYMFVIKNPGGNLALPVADAVGSSDNKRYVIHQEMTMLQNVESGNPSVLFNGVIKIPRGYSRFGPNDTLEVAVFCPSLDITFCLQAHYKEFR